MITTKIFKSGNSLAVRLPRDFGFKAAETIEMHKRGDEVIIRHPSTSLERAFELLANMPDDFMHEGRDNPYPEARHF